MLAVADAQEIVLQHARALPPESKPLWPAALGHVLAEDVAADLDSPPYDKSMMDGYAVRSADLPDGKGVLRVVEEITAGRTPTHELQPGETARIMTGAPLPANADAVVMIERTRLLDDGRVAIEDRPPKPEQHIFRRGTEMRLGEIVVKAGSLLRPQEFGVLATVGRDCVTVFPTPFVSILATGDELVESDQQPQAAQIRNSNGPMLLAQTVNAGGYPYYHGIAEDTRASLTKFIREGLRADVLLITGGVSAGKLDLVPEVLQAAGVVANFHKVAMKPGKPIFFGTCNRSGERAPTLVFGLPGNPVSAFVGFELFVRPALRRLRGFTDAGTTGVQATLSETFATRSDRPIYHPARLTSVEGRLQVRATTWSGSPDLRGLLLANALLVLPPGDHANPVGQLCTVLSLEEE